MLSRHFQLGEISRFSFDSSNLYSTVATSSAGVCYQPAQMLSPGSSSVICLRSLLRGWSAVSAPGARGESWETGAQRSAYRDHLAQR